MSTTQVHWLLICGIAAGSALLLMGLRLAWRLGRVPSFELWRWLTGLIGLFVLGYAGYGWTLWTRPAPGAADVVTTVVFLGGGLFVHLVTSASSRAIGRLERVAREAEHQALHDALTGLPNRALLHDRLERAVVAARRAKAPASILMMDLDRFKAINDTLGHAAGDALLRELAPRLGKAVRELDTIGRLGGDEFAAVLPGVGARDARTIAERLIRATDDPVLVRGHTIYPTLSIGVAEYPADGEDAETLLSRADQAMYVAKRTETRIAAYASAQDPNSVPRLDLVGELREALRQDRLSVHYQPKFCLAKGSITGVEALARWEHPQRGLLHADEVVPLAEENGLIRQLTYGILNGALRDLRGWQSRGFGGSLAVNLSTKNLCDPDLPRDVHRLLDYWKVEPASLVLEITETHATIQQAAMQNTLNALLALGVQFAVDDFGTGYSCLAYLKKFPAAEIKIDRTFVRDMAVDPDDATIVRATIELAHNLGRRVVAEGVESAEALDLLVGMGCDAAQGYHLGRPVPQPELVRLLESRGLLSPALSAFGEEPCATVLSPPPPRPARRASEGASVLAP
jgi:diguanylate cyclase (GGDEF)-like protein